MTSIYARSHGEVGPRAPTKRGFVCAARVWLYGMEYNYTGTDVNGCGADDDSASYRHELLEEALSS